MMLAHPVYWPMPWPWMLIFPLVGLVIMIILAILVFRRGGWMSECMGGRNRRSEEEMASPMEILKRRYASGDISKEEFERIKQDIG